MNDPGLGDVIEKSGDNVHDARRVNEKPRPQTEPTWKQRPTQLGTQENHDEEDEEGDTSIYQPTLWWFASTAFPLFAGTFGPIANLFSVCALVQTWRVGIFDGSRIKDPPWLIALNACSLVLALTANIVLLFNFARRIPYSIAQPITITFWYLASICLLIPICLGRIPRLDPISLLEAHSQSYYYALISCVLYASVSTLLLISTLGATVFHAYKPSFSTLTGPQRTLMLQTISFTLYLSLGAGVFAKIEGWGFADGVYWADYTLLTIGLGTDFPLTSTLSRMLLIPYAAIGITLIGLVISSVRGLVLERAKAKVIRRHLGKEREKWKDNIRERRRLLSVHEMEISTHDSQTPLSATAQKWRVKRKEKELMRLPHRLAKAVPKPLQKHEQQGAWHRAEFELMRYIEQNSESTEQYAALSMSFLIILIVWSGGALVFWSCEHKSQSWTFPESIYFTYTTLLTIGYGDFYPNSAAGKPFFVVWSLISVPAMTVLISNMGDTVVKWVQDVTVWAGRWTILPERLPDAKAKTKTKRRRHSKKVSSSSRGIKPSLPTPSASETEQQPVAPADSEKSNKSNTDEGISPPTTFERDIEYLGERVEEFEEDEGREGSVAARVAREISILARDLRAKPPKKYSWEEWSRWLDMLGEREMEDGKRRVGNSRSKSGLASKNEEIVPETEPEPEPSHIPAPDILNSASIDQQLKVDIPLNAGEDAFSRTSSSSHHNNLNHVTTTESDDVDWHWTWLGDQGPLFSKLTETEWIIEKLCFRLEEVLEDEIREVRARADRKPSKENKA